MVKTVVIDARAHMLGRLASVVAKQILGGMHVVSFPFIMWAAGGVEC